MASPVDHLRVGFVLELILASFAAGWRRRRRPISEPVERNGWLAVGAVALVTQAALILAGSLVVVRFADRMADDGLFGIIGIFLLVPAMVAALVAAALVFYAVMVGWSAINGDGDTRPVFLGAGATGVGAALMAAMATGSVRYLVVLLVPSVLTLAVALAPAAWRPGPSPSPPAPQG